MPSEDTQFKPGNTAGVGYGRPRTYDVDKMADEFVTWAQIPATQNEQGCYTHINIVQFARERNLYTDTLYEWAKTVPRFSCAMKEVKRLLGEKREALGLANKISGTYIKTQAIYDTDYKDLLEWLKSDGKNLADSMGAIKEFIIASKKTD